MEPVRPPGSVQAGHPRPGAAERRGMPCPEPAGEDGPPPAGGAGARGLGPPGARRAGGSRGAGCGGADLAGACGEPARAGEEDALMPNLDRLFHARTVAVVGASPNGGYGRNVIENARAHGFRGELWPVNPRHREVAGLTCRPRLEDLPSPPDLVVIATPAATVPGLIAAAGSLGCGAAVVYAAGFAEAEDRVLQAEVRAAAAAHELPVVGPNCLGVAGFVDGFLPGWALLVRAGRRPGRVGAVLQSGQLANHLVGNHRGLELSYVVSCGNQAVLDAADFIGWLADDPATGVIAAVVEGARDPLRLVAAARRARAAGKPVVALKIGRSRLGAALARSHTGSMAGDDAVWRAVFRRAGAITVRDLDELTATCQLLAACVPHRMPTADGAAFMASSGGECGLAADLAAEADLPLPPLAPETVARLRAVLPPYASPQNPLDYTATGWGNPAIYEPAMRALADEAGVGLVASILDAPIGASEPTLARWEAMRQATARVRAGTGKPVLVVSTLSHYPPEIREPYERDGVVVLQGLAPAVRAVSHLLAFARAGLPDHPAAGEPDPEVVRMLARPLDEPAAKAILAGIGVSVPRSVVVRSGSDPVAAARRIGYPVVVKAVGVPHKSSHGGVVAGVGSDAELECAVAAVREGPRRAGFDVTCVLIEEMVAGAEFFIGAKGGDPPTVVFGLGGVNAEALADFALALAPVGPEEARAMAEGLRSARLLGSFRGRPPRDVGAVVDAVVRVSHLVARHRDRIAELDINPLIVREAGRGCVAADCLVVTR
jgi:acyl-CoA synthetase (NDP forming)